MKITVTSHSANSYHFKESGQGFPRRLQFRSRKPGDESSLRLSPITRLCIQGCVVSCRVVYKHRHSPLAWCSFWLVGYEARVHALVTALQNHVSSQALSLMCSNFPWRRIKLRHHRSLTVIAKHAVGHATPPGRLLVPVLTFLLHITL